MTMNTVNTNAHQDDLPVLTRVLRAGRLPAVNANDLPPPTPEAAPAVVRDLSDEERAALAERLRHTVLDDLQSRLHDLLREVLDEQLEPILSLAMDNMRVEIRDSLHGLVADSIERALHEVPHEQPPH